MTTPRAVPVHIESANEGVFPGTQKTRRHVTSVFRTFALAANSPVPILAEDRSRLTTWIIAYANSVVLCASQNQAQDPANQLAGAALGSAFANTPANPQGSLLFVPVLPGGSSPVTAEALVAGGGGTGTATLPLLASITGFDVTVGTPTASSGATITVTGAAGGTLTYYSTGEGTAVESVPIRFPSPLAPAVPGTAIAVTVVTTAAQGPASVVAYGSSSPSPTTNTSFSPRWTLNTTEVVWAVSMAAALLSITIENKAESY